MSLISKVGSYGPALASRIQSLPFGKVAHLGILLTGSFVIGKRALRFVQEEVLSGPAQQTKKGKK